MKVAIVHDDLMQWGGAERVLLGISEIFPEAVIFTTVFNKDHKILKEKFQDKKIKTSFLQNLPFYKSLYKAFFFLHPIAFEQFDFSGYDLVISQTTRFAKAVITKPETCHICYCHTPPRFLWNFSGQRLPGIFNLYLSFLRIADRVFSTRVDYFLAGSKNSQNRIKKVYNRDSKVLLPFVDQAEKDKFTIFDGGYYLLIARLNHYKRVDVAVEAFNKNGKQLKIVGSGSEEGKLKAKAKPNIEFVGAVSEESLASLLSGCKALIVTAEEDFGLTPLEAQIFGKPVIAYGVGGALETVIENQTGIFFKEQNTTSLEQAVQKFERKKFKEEISKQNAEKFSKTNFQTQMLDLIGEVVKNRG